MRNIVVLLGVLCVIGVHCEYSSNDVDVVLNLLGDLANNSKQEVDTLDQQWAESKAAKQAIINSLSNAVQQQRGECNNRDQDVSNKERDISITLNFIKWLEKRTAENNKRIELFDALRCTSNKNFIGDAKNNRKTTQLVSFLKNAIENASGSNFPALLQKKEFTKHLNKFFAKQAALVQLGAKEDSEYSYYDYEEYSEYETYSYETYSYTGSESDSESDIDVPLDGNDGAGVYQREDAEDISFSQVGSESGAGSESEAGSNAGSGESAEESSASAAGSAAESESESQQGSAVEAESGSAVGSESEFSQIGSEDSQADGSAASSESNGDSEIEQEAEALADVVANEDSPQSPDSPKYSVAQQQLIDMLEDVDQEVKGQFSKFQNNQVVSAMAQNDFKKALQRENQSFEEHLHQENENLTRLSNQLITVLQACANCKARLQQLQQTLQFANEDLASAEENYNSVRERLINEANLFGDVQRVYKNQVASASSYIQSK